ncbi:hypothetical protein CRG98_039352 [Punica granatum]|uniref:Reverse transcriptase Ty1/copia-type domain-containing protein n=1 Tax=Punica granatum TaxID=22663 RepID=A0A2I0I8A7_PUNGR|nr:hypothetical protein CRG98_039352 [Punica granatum]
MGGLLGADGPQQINEPAITTLEGDNRIQPSAPRHSSASSILPPPLDTAVSAPIAPDEPASRPVNRHPMITRSKSGVRMPNPKYAYIAVDSIPGEPHNANSALAHPARLVAKGFHQVEGVDFIETFSPLVKPGTTRAVLNVVVVQNWGIRQLDVKKAFLNGDLDVPVYMEQPLGFRDSDHPDHRKYAAKLLDRAMMSNCKPIATPMAVKSPCIKNGDELFSDPSFFRSVVGAL